MLWRALLVPLTAERLTSVCPDEDGTTLTGWQASYINTEAKSNINNGNTSRYVDILKHPLKLSLFIIELY